MGNRESNSVRRFAGVRTCCAALLLVGVAGLFLFSPRTKPYPYALAYKLGFDYREASVREEEWQAGLATRYPGVDAAALEKAGVKLTKFFPRHPDTEQGALDSWAQRRQSSPFLYLDAKTKAARAPTPEEVKLEKEGWVAGYMDSALRHPKTP
jgi:hypothetical protein